MPIALRTDFDAVMVRAAARRSKDGGQARRLLALAAIYEGSSRTEAARLGGVTLQIVRDWVVKFNASGPDGLIDRKAPGKPPLLNATHRAALVEAIERGPIPAAHGAISFSDRSTIGLILVVCHHLPPVAQKEVAPRATSFLRRRSKRGCIASLAHR